MGFITTQGLRLHGENNTAKSQSLTDFTIQGEFRRGPDIAASAALIPSYPGDYFHITGAGLTTIFRIDAGGVSDGQHVDFLTEAPKVLTHNSAPSGSERPMLLIGGANVTTTANTIYTFRYDTSLGASGAWVMVNYPAVPGTTGVASVTAGTGISITGTGTNPVVNNTGVLLVNAGSGISITGSPASPVVINGGVVNTRDSSGTPITHHTNLQFSNKFTLVDNGTAAFVDFTSGAGVASVTAGTGISITGTGTNPVVNNTGVLSVTGGSQITIGGTAANPTVAVANGSALSVLGVAGGSTGARADIATSSSTSFALRESGGFLGFGQLATGAYGNNTVSYTKIQTTSSANVLLGSGSLGPGTIQELTVSGPAKFSASTFKVGKQYSLTWGCRSGFPGTTLASSSFYIGVGYITEFATSFFGFRVPNDSTAQDWAFDIMLNTLAGTGSPTYSVQVVLNGTPVITLGTFFAGSTAGGTATSTQVFSAGDIVGIRISVASGTINSGAIGLYITGRFQE